jgi:hypothetical protein
VALANSTFGSLFASGTANIARAYQQQAPAPSGGPTARALAAALRRCRALGLSRKAPQHRDTQRAKAHQPESNLAWLNRRVDEVRVRL